MNFLPKPIRTEHYIYYSTSSVDELKAAMQRSLGNTRRLGFGWNISGGFISGDTFKVTQQLSTNNAGWNLTTLNGRVYQDEFKRTTVTFTIKPARVFPVFFFISLLLAISRCLLSLRGVGYEYATFRLIMPFFFPLIVLLLAYFSKQGVKKAFIKTFRLQE